MKYSLAAILKKYENGLIDGVWIQGCMGTSLEEATKRARDTESVNNGGGYGSPLEVAVVEGLTTNGCPYYSLRIKLKRLD